ncbi:MAG: class I SAM-dependent methyltransferase [Chloroflexota bacterium]
MTAAEEWTTALGSWAIPEYILAAAPESPWEFPTTLFAQRADAAVATLSPSNRKALEALPAGGTVLDVGCGAGAASLPLTACAGRLVGVDPSEAMLEAFRERAEARGVAVTTVVGNWPATAADAPDADVVVCHHVAYNVSDLADFARTLQGHARSRVVLELTAEHPLRSLNDLWMRFHGLARPGRPTADDAVAVLREIGIQPGRENWQAPALTAFARPEDLVAWTRRRLCLPPERDAEIAEAIAADLVGDATGRVALPARPVVTLWWDR